MQTVVDAYVAMAHHKSKAQSLIDAWVAASSTFTRRWGVGLVIGVLWGGWGSVNLKFAASSTESKWEGGGTAKFSYASDVTAVDVEATYGHSEDSIGKDAVGTVVALANGACVSAIITKWADDLQAKATASLQSLGTSPLIPSSTMTASIKSPPIPAFEKPSPSEGVTKKSARSTRWTGSRPTPPRTSTTSTRKTAERTRSMSS